MRAFGWLATTDIPAAYDLRRRGWQVEPACGTVGMAFDGVSGLPVLVHRTALPAGEWLHLLGARDGTLRARSVLIGIGDPDERGRLLKLGFGDVVSSAVSLDELDVRADRLAAQAQMLPRHRDIGPLRLDLFARDGFAGKRPLGLHPREFNLLWRLAETPHRTVAKEELVADVWRLGHVPETNSIAVHVSRLRAKLALAGLDGMIETDAAAGYRLVPPGMLAPPAQSMKECAFEPPEC